MSFFARMAARSRGAAVGQATSVGVLPSLRSRSPVAEFDQRFNLAPNAALPTLGGIARTSLLSSEPSVTGIASPRDLATRSSRPDVNASVAPVVPAVRSETTMDIPGLQQPKAQLAMSAEADAGRADSGIVDLANRIAPYQPARWMSGIAPGENVPNGRRQSDSDGVEKRPTQDLPLGSHLSEPSHGMAPAIHDLSIDGGGPGEHVAAPRIATIAKSETADSRKAESRASENEGERAPSASASFAESVTGAALRKTLADIHTWMATPSRPAAVATSTLQPRGHREEGAGMVVPRESNASPRLTIGRIDVEVIVPPPAPAPVQMVERRPSSSAPMPRPTAPIGVSSHLTFGLRQR